MEMEKKSDSNVGKLAGGTHRLSAVFFLTLNVSRSPRTIRGDPRRENRMHHDAINYQPLAHQLLTFYNVQTPLSLSFT